MGCKDKGNRKSEFIAKTQFLCPKVYQKMKSFHESMIKDKYLRRLVSAVHGGNSNEDYIHHINPAEHRARYSFHTKVEYFCCLGN